MLLLITLGTSEHNQIWYDVCSGIPEGILLLRSFQEVRILNFLSTMQVGILVERCQKTPLGLTSILQLKLHFDCELP